MSKEKTTIIPAAPGFFTLEPIVDGDDEEKVVGLARHPIVGWLCTEDRSVVENIAYVNDCSPITFFGCSAIDSPAIVGPGSTEVFTYDGTWPDEQAYLKHLQDFKEEVPPAVPKGTQLQ